MLWQLLLSCYVALACVYVCISWLLLALLAAVSWLVVEQVQQGAQAVSVGHVVAVTCPGHGSMIGLVGSKRAASRCADLFLC